jgi:hypothetical protein
MPELQLARHCEHVAILNPEFNRTAPVRRRQDRERCLPVADIEPAFRELPLDRRHKHHGIKAASGATDTCIT